MLQQTQVKTVIPFFKKFLKKYPNLKSLSEATEEDILALWTGLGFYRRAKNIFKTKEILKKDFKNIFPKTFENIVSLPGIGESTAGAIMSIAYKRPFPILDANVKRTLSRFESIKNDSTTKSNKVLWEFSRIHTPKEKIFEYTQGIMDMGATVCTPLAPSCDICPANKLCKSAFSVLLSDNINKIPRDLNEVGPTDTEYTSSQVLNIRVNNPRINNRQSARPYGYPRTSIAWNTQYYPGNIAQEVLSIQSRVQQ